MYNKIFGQRLKELRKSAGYIQALLAEKIGIDEKHLSRIENRKFFPTLETLNGLLEALNTNIQEIGLDLSQLKINTNVEYSKIMKILNVAKEDDFAHYLAAIKVVEKILKR